MFGGDDLPGVDAVLPDLSYLIENATGSTRSSRHTPRGPHRGAAVPADPPVVADLRLPFTLGMIDHNSERGLQKNAELRPVHDGDRIDIGPFDCEFLPVTHSIPSGNITAFRTRRA